MTQCGALTKLTLEPKMAKIDLSSCSDAATGKGGAHEKEQNTPWFIPRLKFDYNITLRLYSGCNKHHSHYNGSKNFCHNSRKNYGICNDYGCNYNHYD